MPVGLLLAAALVLLWVLLRFGTGLASGDKPELVATATRKLFRTGQSRDPIENLEKIWIWGLRGSAV